MGKQTFVTGTPMTKPAKTTRPIRLRMDVPLMLAVLTLLVIGLLFVYSASWRYSIINDLPATYYLSRQILWVLLGLAVAVVASVIDYHKYKKLLLPGMFLVIALLLVVLIVKDERNGATRTILNGSVQPSELAGLAVILYLAFWLYGKREVLNQVSFGLFPLMFILGVLTGLIMLQPDLSAAIIVLLLGAVMFYLAGGELRQIVPVFAVSGLLGYLVVMAYPNWSTRLTDYFAFWQDPANAPYHVSRSIEAVVRGGIFGQGIGMSSTKFTGLPFAWTDSIFAVITEETGLVGATVVILLFMVILWRGLRIAQHAPDLLGKLIAAGITLWIVIEALVNMSVLISLLPFAGNALPLVSAGGSSLVTTMAGLGILMNIARANETQQTTEEGRSYGAVVDMRRRDRRRSVSRPVGSESNPD
mgnify:CR=1 FL=1